MEQTHKEHPKYMKIFWILLVLTVAEVFAGYLVYLKIPRVVIVLLLIGLACSKAAYVALYFMHLKFEQKTLTAIAITPFIICVFLVLMLLPDLMAEARDGGPGKPESHAVETSH